MQYFQSGSCWWCSVLFCTSWGFIIHLFLDQQLFKKSMCHMYALLMEYFLLFLVLAMNSSCIPCALYFFAVFICSFMDNLTLTCSKVLGCFLFNTTLSVFLPYYEQIEKKMLSSCNDESKKEYEERKSAAL